MGAQGPYWWQLTSQHYEAWDKVFSGGHDIKFTSEEQRVGFARQLLSDYLKEGKRVQGMDKKDRHYQNDLRRVRMMGQYLRRFGLIE